MKRALRPKGRHARFVSYEVDSSAVRSLKADHPAVIEGRSVFPKSVRRTMDSPRFLVEGVNSPKTGGRVTKGPWKTFPIYTLTLEERASCPRSCPVWRECYGNSTHWARRHDHTDPDFIAGLAAEVITVARQHPKGFVIRLHILGDFFSPGYVLMWAHLLSMLPQLHVFGYTARRADRDDAESRRTARALAVLTGGIWSRFAIRTSHDLAGPGRSIVVREDPKQPDVIVCPAQTGATDCCGTCGLCWAPAARDKTIAFLLHGLSR